MVGLGPFQGQLVERVACFGKLVVVIQQRFVQTGNPQRSMAQHVTVNCVGAAQRVVQPGPTRANEAHRYLDPGLVEWRHNTNENVVPTGQRREPGGNTEPGERGLHRLVVDQDRLVRSHVAQPGSARAFDANDLQQPEPGLAQYGLRRRRCSRSVG